MLEIASLTHLADAADAAPIRRGNDILARVAHVETSIINSKRNVHEEIPDLRRAVHEEIPDLRRGEHGDIPQLG